MTVLSFGNLDLIGKVPQAFLAASRVTRMDPESRRLRKFLSYPVAVFDGKLRFPTALSALRRRP
jgi:hypothetical protein